LLATGTDVGEIFLWSFLDYSFIQQIPGITKFQKLLVVLNYCQLTINCITGHSDSVNKLSFSRDCSKLLSCSDDCCFKVFDSNSGLELYTNTLKCPLK